MALAQAFFDWRRLYRQRPVGFSIDNIYHGHQSARQCRVREQGGSVFAYHVQDPERYGVVEFDGAGKAISLKKTA
jgi:glucose-1-phosphate thymidylyltransferase